MTRKDFDGEITTVAIAETQDNAPIEQGLTGDAELLYYPTRRRRCRRSWTERRRRLLSTRIRHSFS